MGRFYNFFPILYNFNFLSLNYQPVVTVQFERKGTARLYEWIMTFYYTLYIFFSTLCSLYRDISKRRNIFFFFFTFSDKTITFALSTYISQWSDLNGSQSVLNNWNPTNTIATVFFVWRLGGLNRLKYYHRIFMEVQLISEYLVTFAGMGGRGAWHYENTDCKIC